MKSAGINIFRGNNEVHFRRIIFLQLSCLNNVPARWNYICGFLSFAYKIIVYFSTAWYCRIRLKLHLRFVLCSWGLGSSSFLFLLLSDFIKLFNLFLNFQMIVRWRKSLTKSLWWHWRLNSHPWLSNWVLFWHLSLLWGFSHIGQGISFPLRHAFCSLINLVSCVNVKLRFFLQITIESWGCRRQTYLALRFIKFHMILSWL